MKILRNQLNLFLLAGLTQAASIDQPQLAQITGCMNAFVASGSIAGAERREDALGEELFIRLAANNFDYAAEGREAELWVEVTIPPTGPPRPIRLEKRLKQQ